MTIKYTNLFDSKALQNLPKFGFFGLKIYHLATLGATGQLFSTNVGKNQSLNNLNLRLSGTKLTQRFNSLKPWWNFFNLLTASFFIPITNLKPPSTWSRSYDFGIYNYNV
jgi:hypothetical protein